MLHGSDEKILVMTAPGSDGSVMGFRAANDGKVGNFAGPGRVVGGLVRGSGELTAHKEVVENLFDGNNTTKWLDLDGANQRRHAWVEYRLMPDAQPVVLSRYLLTSANDHPERDPAEWVLEGLTAQCDNRDSSEQLWMVLDHQQQHKWRKRKQTDAFPISRRVACCSFRLRIIRPQHAPAMVQLSCLDLFHNPMELQHVGARLSALCPCSNDPPLGLTIRARERLVHMQTWQGSGLHGGKQQGGLTHPVPPTKEYPAWAEWVVAEGQSPAALQAYSFMMNVDGDAQKAPRSWVLEGEPAGGALGMFAEGSWLELDRQEGVSISVNDMGQPLFYRVAMPLACTRFRLRVTAGHYSDGTGVSISRIFFHEFVPELPEGATASPAPSPRPAPSAADWPGTDWREAGDFVMEEELALKGRLYGGWCRCSDEMVEHGELVQNAFDTRPETKWLDTGGAVTSRPAWMEYRLMPDVPPVVLSFYSIVSANDHLERDPQDWTLEGWVDVVGEEGGQSPSVPAVKKGGIPKGGVSGTGDAVGPKNGDTQEAKEEGEGEEGEAEAEAVAAVVVPRGKWVVLDEQRAVAFEQRHQEVFFEVRKAVCQRFRLSITATRHPGAFMQLACLNLFVQPRL